MSKKVGVQKVKLPQLKLLAEEGKTTELQTALKQCLFSDLREYLNALGIKVRTKQYEEIRSKEDHVELLANVLTKRTISGGCAHLESNDGAAKPLVPTQSELDAVDHEEGVLVPNTPIIKDAERMHLVHCINFVGYALTSAESRKENVTDLKRTLTTELVYYVKRLKRIQEEDEA